jgi:Fe-S oxidoreductase
MCPIFRFAPAEESSPRAKANLLRGILTGALPPTTLTSDEFKAVTDLCVNCHQCRLECPATVDIPKLMMEGKANYVLTNGLNTSDWLMSRIDRLSRLGSLLAPLANWAIANRSARWLMEKTLGVAQRRKLPRFAARSFLRIAARRRQSTLFRRHLCQLPRSTTGRSLCRRARAQRGRRVRASGAAVFGHADDFVGRTARGPQSRGT